MRRIFAYSPDNPRREDVLAASQKLAALLPGLEFSRQTHVEWRDCDQSWRDRNPSIGDSAFHDKCVKEYDERIASINEAIKALSAMSDQRDTLLRALKCALPHVEHAYHTNPDPDGSFWVDVVGCRAAIAKVAENPGEKV